MDLTSIRDITAQQPGTGTAMNVTVPSNQASGDLALVFIYAYQPTAAPTGIPTGFSQLLALTIASEMGGYIYGKVTGGSEPATYNFTWGSIGGWSARAALITGSLVDLSSFPSSALVNAATVWTNTGTSVTVAQQAGLPSGALLVGHVASRVTGGTISSNGSVMAALWNTDAFSSRSGRTFHQATSGDTGTRTFDVSSSTVHTAGLIALKPAATSPVGGDGAIAGAAPMIVQRTHANVTVFTRSMARAARRAMGRFARTGAGLYLPEAYAR